MNIVKNEEALTKMVGPGTIHKVLSYDDNLMVCELTMEEGATGKEHSHPHTQITYIVSGEHAFLVDGETKIVKAGDTVYIPSGAMHNATCLKPGKIVDIFSPKREDFLQ
ncbi:cupin domain-containing protein [Clostridiales bacterium COT073_COT-073]|nr:cupin domain-containing protein [Clostridiales bacterium COT073_COT-073]